jgi:uncharacterized protein (DUF2249 family)
MIINANTRIGAILKEQPAALDTIIAISDKFEKLRNPLLRKLIATRTSLATASKFGGCELEDFYEKLEPLGFIIDRIKPVIEGKNKKRPGFMKDLSSRKVVELDVRPVLQSGKDPLNIIMAHVKTIQPGEVLRVINSFEPTPLIHLLEKKGFETYIENIGSDHVDTYFFKKDRSEVSTLTPFTNDSKGFDEVLNKFGSNIQEIDVHHLEMPQPMMNILEALDHLPEDKALFVYHKRIPVFLFPELSQRGFDYRVREISDSETHLLIFRS